MTFILFTSAAGNNPAYFYLGNKAATKLIYVALIYNTAGDY